MALLDYRRPARQPWSLACAAIICLPQVRGVRVTDSGEPKSIEARLRDWIGKQGYPLEMRAAEALRDVGASFDHGRVYDDPETKKSREIDLMGYFDEETSVHVIFECKHSDKPWVIFATDKYALNPKDYLPYTPATQTMLTLLRQNQERTEPLLRMAMYEAPHRHGFTLVRAFGDNQDQAHHALGTLVAASTALSRRHSEYGHSVLYVPVVLVDSPLFICYMQPGQPEPVLEPATLGVVVQPIGGSLRMPIRVLHVDGLPEWLARVKADTAELNTILGPIGASAY